MAAGLVLDVKHMHRWLQDSDNYRLRVRGYNEKMRKST